LLQSKVDLSIRYFGALFLFKNRFVGLPYENLIAKLHIHSYFSLEADFDFVIDSSFDENPKNLDDKQNDF